MGFERSQLDNESVNAAVFLVNDQLGHDDGVVARLGRRAGPKFDRRQRRTVQYELLRRLIVRGRRLEASQIGAMSDFRLYVGAKYGVRFQHLFPVLVLFGRAPHFNGIPEHCVMQIECWLLEAEHSTRKKI